MPKFLKINKKNILIALGVFLFVLFLFFANLLSSFLLIKTDKTTYSLSSNPLTFYTISFDKALSEKSAQSLATDYQKLGGSGYVIEHEEYFYILSSSYLNKNDAQLVQNSIKTNQNIETTMIELKANSINFNISLDSEEKKVFQKALNAFENAYKLLFDIAISLDTLVYNEVSARLAINSAFSTINTIASDFDILFGEVEEENIKTLNSYLKLLTQTMQKLCSGLTISKEQTLSSLIKYRYCEIIDLSIKLSNELNTNKN